MMLPKSSELRIQQLLIRKWLHVAFSVLYVTAALFCAFNHVLVGAILLVAAATLSGVIIKRSVEELSRLRGQKPNVGYGVSKQDMTTEQLQRRSRKLRIRAWLSIVAAAIFASIALFFTVKHNLIGALPIIGLGATSALVMNRSVEELSQLRDHEAETG